MAVPSSGALSMLGLAREKVYDNYSSGSTPTAPYSMYDLANGGNTGGSGVSFDATNTASSSYPNTSTPHQMSEWYSYDHDASSLPSFGSTSSQGTATAACPLSRNAILYHNGSNQVPTTGDEVYSDAAGSNTVDAGYYGICGGNDGTLPVVLNIGATGIVSSVLICFPTPSPNPCPI